MSWLNGAILAPRDLLITKSIDVGARYKFGEDVKLWLDIGDTYTAISAMVSGVTIGAEGRVNYKLAIPIADTGLFTQIEAPSAMVTGPEVIAFKGFDWGAPSEEVRKVFGKNSLKLSTAPSGSSGFLIDAKVFDKVGLSSPRLANLLLRIANSVLIERSKDGQIDCNPRIARITQDSFIIVMFGNEVKIFGVNGHAAFPFRVGFNLPGEDNYTVWQYTDAAVMEQKFIEDLVHFFITGTLNGVGQ